MWITASPSSHTEAAITGAVQKAAPDPVAEDPQDADGEVGHGHFMLEGVARGQPDAPGGRIGHEGVGHERQQATEPDAQHEDPYQEHLRHAARGARLPVPGQLHHPTYDC